MHRVLERIDFTAADLDAELAGAGVDDAGVRAGLAAAIETPLGPLVGELRLRDVARADRLDELGFELPLAGADAPSGEVDLAAVADVLAAPRRRRSPTMRTGSPTRRCASGCAAT